MIFKPPRCRCRPRKIFCMLMSVLVQCHDHVGQFPRSYLPNRLVHVIAKGVIALPHAVISLFPKISFTAFRKLTVPYTLARGRVSFSCYIFNLRRISAGFAFSFIRNLIYSSVLHYVFTMSDAILNWF